LLVFEYKLKGKADQYRRIDEAIRTGQFIRNSCLKYWKETRGTTKNDLQKYCAVLAANPDFPWAKKLNSMARQAHADRAWNAIARFFDNVRLSAHVEACKSKVPGKKGYPRFKKHSHSVEYKTSGWKLSKDRKTLTLTDGFEAGRFKLKGSRDLNFYEIKQIKRVRIVKRADGYYAQFCIDVERKEKILCTGSEIGIDVGLSHFLTDSNGEKVDNPRHLRAAQKRLKKSQRRMSRRYKNPKKGKKGEVMVKTFSPQSKRYHKARVQVARKHLGVSRRRKDFVVKTARCVIQSNDLVAYEDLKVRNMVKNHKLALSISDAGWSMFREWLEYFAKIFDKVVIAVPPHYTSQNCSTCGTVVKKSLSVRTHCCPACRTVLDRDENAAINILMKAFEMIGKNTVGHTEINAQEQSNLCLAGETLPGKLAGKTLKGKN
jgi:putative transposase